MREVKAGSSRWVHGEIGERAFEWQEATAASPSARRNVRRRATTSRGRTSIIACGRYQEEYLVFLQRGGVEYDERYLW